MHLPWLLPPSADFRGQVRQLRSAPPERDTLLRLASRSLDLNQLALLGKLVSGHRELIARSGDFQEVRVALVGSHTLDYIADALVATGLRYGVLVSVETAHYGQVAQAILDDQSGLPAGAY